MGRTAIVVAYAFTATDGTNVSDLNSGNDWAEQNGINGQLRIESNGFNDAFATNADCCWKGTGVGSFVADQYAKIQILGGPFSNSDRLGISLLNNGLGQASMSMYRVYYDDVSGSPGVVGQKIVGGGAPSSIGSNIAGVFAANDFLEAEAFTVGGTITFLVYKNGGQIGTFSDSTSILTTGVPGIMGGRNAGTLRGDNFEAGNVTASVAAGYHDHESTRGVGRGISQ